MCIQNHIDRLRHQRKNDSAWHNLCLGLFQSGKHKWRRIQRACPCDPKWLAILERAIRKNMVDKLIVEQPSDLMYRILSLSLRFGGLGIANPCVNSVKEWQYYAIMYQALDSSKDSDSLATRLQTASEKIRRMRQLDLKEVFQAISEECDPDRKIALEHATVKDASKNFATALRQDITQHYCKRLRNVNVAT
ncbi:hypothetical protein GJ496_011877 [Pomphorhynchus laevis]|nr:hypothetical protein GJ496_011877 [Pomphorhynchus laevis]